MWQKKKKRKLNPKQQIRKKERMLKLLCGVELLCILGIIIFLIGKHVDAKGENEEIFVNSVFSEKIWDRYNQQILKYV